MKKIQTQRPLLTCLLLLILMIAPQVQATNLQNPEELEAFFDGSLPIQLTSYHIPGATVAIVKDGEIVFSKGYGFADLENRIPMDPATTLHRPGSNSKILVWTAVMQLIEQGNLDLYADINTYLDFAIPSRIASGREVPPITLHHLLTHTAGFEDEVIQMFVSGPDLIQPLGDYVKNRLPARVFTPGSIVAYSNYGTTLAAYIVEVVSGQAFGEYITEHILNPLEMASSTFEQPLPTEIATQMSKGYRYEAGLFVPGGFEYLQSYPAGALTSTTHDMARLIIGHLSLLDGENSPESEASEGEDALQGPILQGETALLMQTQQFSGHPEIPGMTYGLFEADYNGYRVLAHGGDTFLFTTGLYFLPEENVGFYVAYNAAVGERARLSLFQAFMDRYFPPASQGIAFPRPVTAGTEKNYSGVFQPSRSNFTGIEKLFYALQPIYVRVDGDQYVNVTAYGTTTRYGEIAPNLFQELNGTNKIAFTFEDGQVTKIHLAGPNTLLRTPWHQTPFFLTGLLSISVLIILVTILGWIRTRFQPQIRRATFTAPKVIGVLFFLVLITSIVLLGDVITTVHPTFGVPLVALEPSSTLNVALLFTKILMGLASLMLLTNIYLVITAKGSRWQRVYYTLLTLSSLSVTWVFWTMNLL